MVKNINRKSPQVNEKREGRFPRGRSFGITLLDRLPGEGDGPKDVSPISQSRRDDALVDSFENDGQADEAKTWFEVVYKVKYAGRHLKGSTPVYCG